MSCGEGCGNLGAQITYFSKLTRVWVIAGAMLAGVAVRGEGAPPVRGGSKGAVARDDGSRLIEMPVDWSQVQVVRSMVHLPRTRTQAPPPGGGGTPGDCSTSVTWTDPALFSGGTYSIEAGMAPGEYAAVSYQLAAADFPIQINTVEIVWATSNATSQTTTQYTWFVWQGNPNTGTQVASFSSSTDPGDAAPVVVGPGTAGVDLQVGVDPTDTDQIFINDDGSHTFSTGFRIDHLNNQPNGFNYCTASQPPANNAYPVVDHNGLGQPTRNWLYGLNCGSFGCPPNGGWSTFQNLNFLCRPTGDWVIRVNYTKVNCGNEATIGTVSVDHGTPTATPSAYNACAAHVTISGTNFVAGSTTVALNTNGQAEIDGTNVVVSNNGVAVAPGGTGNQIDCDLALGGASPGTWTMAVIVSTITGAPPTVPFTISSAPLPTVTSVVVSGSTANDHVEHGVRVRGGGFLSCGQGTAVKFTNATTNYQIDATDISIGSGGELTCSVDLRCAPTGEYNCNATTLVGVGPTLNNALPVTGSANPPPTVFGADQTDAGSCPGTLSLTIFGSDFTNGVTAFLVSGAQSVAASGVVYGNPFDPTSFVATFDQTMLTPGNWNLKVVNPDCQSAVTQPSDWQLAVSSCTPVVASVSPTTANNQQSGQVLTICGTNLLPGATARLLKAGQTIVATSNVSTNGTGQCTSQLLSMFNLQLAATGTWNVKVTNPGGVDSNTNITFSITLGPAPGVSLVTPGSPGNCGNFHATINGSNYVFLTGSMAAKLTLAGQSDIVGSNVTRVSNTQVTADFNMNGVMTTPGSTKWNCVVTNPDGQSSTNGTNKVNVVCCATLLHGDMNGDGVRDGLDVNAYVRVQLTGTGTPTELCAYSGVSVSSFVSCLLGNGCP